MTGPSRVREHRREPGDRDAAADGAVVVPLFVPLTLVALGIVLRGASFAFRKVVFVTSELCVFGVIFATSSVLVPYCMGAVAGAIASGRVPSVGGRVSLDSWVNPTSILGGVLAVVVVVVPRGCLPGLGRVADRDDSLVEYFRRRAVVVSVVAGLVVFVGLRAVQRRSLHLRRPDVVLFLLVIVSALCGIGSLVLLVRVRTVARGARGGRGR